MVIPVDIPIKRMTGRLGGLKGGKTRAGGRSGRDES